MAVTVPNGRTLQKQRTREALIAACRDLVRSGRPVTMPAVAERARVSEATAYRHFADLPAVILAALPGLWPSPVEVFAPLSSPDPVVRIEFLCDFYLRRIHAYQGSVRAMIAETITHPGRARERPGLRTGFLDEALRPWSESAGSIQAARCKVDLSAVMSPEALFNLLDQAGLDLDAAVASITRTARAVVASALGCAPAR